MRALIKIVLVGLFLGGSLNSEALALSDSTRSEVKGRGEPKKKFIVKFTYLRNVDFLEVNPGFRLFHSHILGSLKIGDSGVYFTPFKSAPDGLPEANFNRHWWYNSFFKDLYIPYTDIKRVKKYPTLVILTKNGKKLKFVTKKYKQYKREIASHLK